MYLRRRLSLLEGEIEKKRLDSLLVTNPANLTYLSGFTGHDSLALITRKNKFFITDSRYIEEAVDEIKGFDVRLVTKSTYATIKDIAEEEKLKRLGFESMNLPYGVANRLKSIVAPAKLIPAAGLVETLRSLKDEEELKLIRGAIGLTKKVFKKLSLLVRPGVPEEHLRRIIEGYFLKEGAKAAFDPIIASGKNSSKPHARATAKKIENNTFVMLDVGCSLKRYCSDITRMFLLGKASNAFKKIYGIVRGAQELALEKIMPGARICDIDLAARDYIDCKGYGKRFAHSLGHGVGMDVHEEPNISRSNETRLKPGMVFTVEPAIYIPNFGGVRIEDMVLVTDRGCEILTR